MLFQLQSFLSFLWQSKNEHGVHSPFVFALVTRCFYDKKKKPEYTHLKNYRKELLDNKNTITVTDFGAGSRVFKSPQRQVSKIAQTAGISPKRAELLCRIVQFLQPKSILEIGTSVGLATSALALGNPKAKITTLEGCPETSKIAKEQLQQSNFENVTTVTTQFETFFTSDQLDSDYDFIYFDGNHSKEATLHYFEHLVPTINNETVWIFDDIHWSSTMEEAWDIIKKHPKVKVTIDTFQWGMVFFRKEQAKEHFVIRV